MPIYIANDIVAYILYSPVTEYLGLHKHILAGGKPPGRDLPSCGDLKLWAVVIEPKVTCALLW